MRYILLTTFLLGLWSLFILSQKKIDIIDKTVKMNTLPLYIASKSGSVFGFPWCGSMPRVKIENTLIFSHKNDALSRGLRPMKGCRGLL